MIETADVAVRHHNRLELSTEKMGSKDTFEKLHIRQENYTFSN